MIQSEKIVSDEVGTILDKKNQRTLRAIVMLHNFEHDENLVESFFKSLRFSTEPFKCFRF